MTQTSDNPNSILRCFTGAFMSGTLATLVYSLTRSVIQTFAAKPIHSDSVMAINIGVAVRTLVIGVCALGTFVFALAAVGLMALGFQLLLQRLTQSGENDRP